MNQTKRVVIIWALVLSPVWVGALVVLVQPYQRGNPGMLLSQAIGVAIIGLTGLLVSLLTRKSKDASRLSIIGYAVPAVLVCCCQLFVILK